MGVTDSGLPMILANALEQSLSMSAAATASTGTLVLRLSCGIACYGGGVESVDRGTGKARALAETSRKGQR